MSLLKKNQSSKEETSLLTNIKFTEAEETEFNKRLESWRVSAKEEMATGFKAEIALLKEEIEKAKTGSTRITEDGDLDLTEKESKVLGSTLIMGSNYIGENCSIYNSILRETSVLLGNNKVSLSELKNSTLGVGTNAPHFNYIGDSYVGENCNFGAGTKVSNVRNDNKPIKVFLEKKDKLVTTKYRKLGIFTGDNVKFGINTSIGQPGLLIGSNVKTAPGSRIFRNLISQ